MKVLQIAAKAALADLPKNIIVTGKGVSRVNLMNGELYDRSPINDLHHQNVAPSTIEATAYEDSVDIFVGEEASLQDVSSAFGAVFQVRVDENGAPVEHQSPQGVTIWTLDNVEFVRNEFN